MGLCVHACVVCACVVLVEAGTAKNDNAVVVYIIMIISYPLLCMGASIASA